MKNVVQSIDEQEKKAKLSPMDCSKVIEDAAKFLRVLPEQLKSCCRETMQKTARKLSYVVWPDAQTRALVSASNVCKEKLDLIHSK